MMMMMMAATIRGLWHTWVPERSLGKVERIGMGVRNMRIAMKKAAGLEEPIFETNGFFRATFPRPSSIQKDFVGSEEEAQGPDDMSEERRKNVGKDTTGNREE